MTTRSFLYLVGAEKSKMFRQKTVLFLALTAIMAIATACSSATPTPTPVPPSPTPTATPTPTPTPVPVAPIEVDWTTDPDGFFNSLPASEASCAADALGGRERVLAMIESNLGDERLTPAEASDLDKCLSDETVKAVFVGQLAREAGTLSDATIICIGEQIGGMSAASLFLNEPAADVIISSLKGVFCLNTEERAAMSSSDATYGFGELGGIEAVECVVNGVGPTGLESLMGVVGSIGVDFGELGDLFPIMINCGAIDDSQIEEFGLTADQIGCMLSSLGEDGLTLLDPSAAESDIAQLGLLMTALGNCEISLDDLMGTATLPINSEPLVVPTVLPTVQIESPEDIADLDLPFSEEQIVCLIEELGEEKIADLLAGGAPDPSLFTAFGKCEVDLAALLGG
ncbi:MAG: hypothetical protein QGF24_04045 [Dehalococcoidia bacterium]|nr:hypothetical protein [Dehalococcoidia bacterium]